MIPQALVAVSCLLFGLLPGFAIGADPGTLPKNPLPVETGRPSLHATLQLSPFDANGIHPGAPMVLNPFSSAFGFDLAGSDTPKLQLSLAHPLVLEAGTYIYPATPGARVLGMDATVRMPVSKGLNLQGTVDQVLGTSQFHSLGSIQCMNGTLKPDSYTASGCRFVSEPGPAFDSRTLILGATHETDSTAASVSWFTSQAEQGNSGVFRMNQFAPAPLLDQRLLTPLQGSGGFPGIASDGSFSNETTGIDLNVQVGFATSETGGIQLGLALTRVLDAHYQEISGLGADSVDWRLADAFNSAALGVEWVHGAFTSGIRGYYREPVSFLNRENLASESTFDVHFTWRTPWSANLSIGASNILGAGTPEDSDTGKNTDRFESVYGRIPYVRYQQDL